MMTPTPMRTALVCFALASLMASVALAGGKDGYIYVQEHFPTDQLQDFGGAEAEVYVYTTEGTLVHSNTGTGSWKTGAKIPLAPGDYLVEVGRSRTRHNLKKYTVKSGEITEVATGWVAVVTWPADAQPDRGCSPWNATLRAYKLEGDKEHLVTLNKNARGERGRIQLPAGTYRIHWHGLTTDVEVKPNHIHYLATGGVGPYPGNEARLFAEKNDTAGVPHVDLCDNGPTHVIAGTWWLFQTEKTEKYPFEKRTWQEIEVPALDEARDRELKTDKLKGRMYRGTGSEGVALTPEELAKLADYKEGKLKKRPTTGGKFNLDSDPF